MVCVFIYIYGGGLVAKSCAALGNPIDCSPPGSSVHGILPARILVWGFPPSHWREQERFS